jgi:anti-sigma factor RsiW
MNDIDRDELLAGYLGDELNEADRARFEAMMADDADLAAEAAALRRTIEAMRALDAAAPGMGDAPLLGHAPGIGPAPPKAGVTPATPLARPLRVWGGAVIRYAAVIGLAFAAGYVMRGGETPPALTGSSTARPIDDAGGEAPLPAERAAGQWLRRAGEVYLNRPGGSSFARSLVAIAEAGEDDR